MLSEVTLGPGDLRRELLVVAAAAGDVSMLLLLLERLGPWMGEEVHALSALAPGRRAVALAALRAAAAPQLAARLLRTCCKLCGGWLEPAADVMAWALRETTNPAALDLMVSGTGPGGLVTSHSISNFGTIHMQTTGLAVTRDVSREWRQALRPAARSQV